MFRYGCRVVVRLEGCISCVVFFFFQAEDGIRDVAVTGVQTCALPIYRQPATPGFVSSILHQRCPRCRKGAIRSEEHTSELQSRLHLVCRLLLEKKKTQCCVLLHLTSSASPPASPTYEHIPCNASTCHR